MLTMLGRPFRRGSTGRPGALAGRPITWWRRGRVRRAGPRGARRRGPSRSASRAPLLSVHRGRRRKPPPPGPPRGAWLKVAAWYIGCSRRNKPRVVERRGAWAHGAARTRRGDAAPGAGVEAGRGRRRRPDSEVRAGRTPKTGGRGNRSRSRSDPSSTTTAGGPRAPEDGPAGRAGAAYQRRLERSLGGAHGSRLVYVTMAGTTHRSPSGAARRVPSVLAVRHLAVDPGDPGR